MLTPEQKREVQTIVDQIREEGRPPATAITLALRYLKGQDVPITVEPDVEHGAITIRF